MSRQYGVLGTWGAQFLGIGGRNLIAAARPRPRAERKCRRPPAPGPPQGPPHNDDSSCPASHEKSKRNQKEVQKDGPDFSAQRRRPLSWSSPPISSENGGFEPRRHRPRGGGGKPSWREMVNASRCPKATNNEPQDPHQQSKAKGLSPPCCCPPAGTVLCQSSLEYKAQHVKGQNDSK